jgi:hypothetical protein
MPRARHDQAARGFLVEPMDEPGPEAEVAFHGIDDAYPHAFAGLDCKSRRLVYDEDIIVGIQGRNHGAKAYAHRPREASPETSPISCPSA